MRPDGTRFFSLGVCCVTPGAARKDYDVSNPQYAAWQHYADSNAWAKATLQRLGEWGFRNIAALEVPSTLLGESRLNVGDVVEFKSTFVGHCRSYRTDWSGSFILRK